MMNKTLVVTLHKQHYKDFQSDFFVSRISCLGYYDEISIEEVRENEAEYSLVSKPNPFSNFWYRAALMNRKLTGNNSNLNVGLFRDVEKDENTYWKNESNLPFFGIGFLKLSNPMEYSETIKRIERLNLDKEKCGNAGGIWEKQRVEVGEQYEKITYCCLDSAELVVLVKANKLSLIEEIFCIIEKDVMYLHSIVGIDEYFLKDYHKELIEAKKNGVDVNFKKWKDNKVFLKEEIKKLGIRVVTCGSDKTIKEILSEWNRQKETITYKKMSCSYKMGHANVSFDIIDTNVESLIRLLLYGGFLTHSNSLYNKGVYNIESTICMKEKNDSQFLLEILKGEIDTDYYASRKYYCDEIIRAYRQLIDNHSNKYDEGFYSYVQALFLTLNAVAQYEKFEMSKDLFWILYPSLKMFNEQMISNWNTLLSHYPSDKIYMDRMLFMKETLCSYLEAVDSVIYHTIHTDQVYLMIPGYSGTSFSIPVKLSLFYMWFVEAISSILNDNGRKYSCILTPVMEAKPSTKIFEMDSENKDKIIGVRLSQRQLYFPTNLMVILAHELGHYIGKGIRCRKVRMDCLLKNLSYYMIEALIPDKMIKSGLMDEADFVWKWLVEYKKPILHEVLLNKLTTLFSDECQDKEYHRKNIQYSLKKVVSNILSSPVLSDGIQKELFDVSGELLKYVNEEPKEYISRMKRVYEVQSYIDRNRQYVAASNVFEYIIDGLIVIYQEIFSDVAALEILKCDMLTIKESFLVSEGIKYQSNVEAPANILRKKIIARLLGDNIYENTYYMGPCDDVVCYLKENMFHFIWLEDTLFLYAKACSEKINSRLKEKRLKEEIEQVRDTFEKFSKQDDSQNDLYKLIVENGVNYITRIKKQYEEYHNDE